MKVTAAPRIMMHRRPLVVKVDPEKPDAGAVRLAAEVLLQGGLVAFPTETVYGLGAVADNREAVIRIFKVKGRPPDNPLILHLASAEWLHMVARDIPPAAYRLAEKFWPGPLTLILHRSANVIDEVTASLPKVAVRVPAHPVAQLLLEKVGRPVAAPSANKSGRPSPTSAEHVLEDFDGEIDAVVDAGETLHGVESTIIDLTAEPPVLLRPGALPVEEVEKVLGSKIVVPEFARGLGEADVALAPGTKYRHYAPRAEMLVVEAEDYSNLTPLVEEVKRIALEKASKGLRVGVLCSDETREAYTGVGLVESLGPRSNMFLVARNLFKALRKLDRAGIDFIVAEGFEERGLGLTVMNRLRKAAGFNRVFVASG